MKYQASLKKVGVGVGGGRCGARLRNKGHIVVAIMAIRTISEIMIVLRLGRLVPPSSSERASSSIKKSCSDIVNSDSSDKSE